MTDEVSHISLLIFIQERALFSEQFILSVNYWSSASKLWEEGEFVSWELVY